jgi:hypothetical protein
MVRPLLKRLRRAGAAASVGLATLLAVSLTLKSKHDRAAFDDILEEDNYEELLDSDDELGFGRRLFL